MTSGRTTHLLRLLAAAAISLLQIAMAQAIPSRPEPPRLVNDYASLMTVAQRETLESVLVAFDDSTTNQIAVITTTDLEGYGIADYATRIGLEWQVGSSKFDNGIVLVVKPKTADSSGQVFIAVGYGLEGAVPDVYAKRIVNNVLIPAFMNNDYYGGISSACTILMKLASGEISELRESEDDSAAALIGTIVVLILLFIILAALFGDGGSGKGNGGRRPVIYTGPVITSGRNYGGFGGFGGGGFGGGFGGFGGGSFGGGGAGGSW